MKNIFFIAVLFSMVLLSCKKEVAANQEIVGVDSVQTEQPEIITDSVTNAAGVTLKMQFDNAAETALLEFNGEKIELKQERMASGIKYSNADYEFTEHQGKMELSKAGKVIYSYED